MTLNFQNVEEMYRSRVLKGAVEEAQHYPRMLCNQHCKTHIYIKNGVPYDQATGLKHDCIVTRHGKMWTAHLNMIMISRVREASIQTLEDVLANQEKFNKRWEMAWQKWKKTGKVPMTAEVNEYVIE